MAVQTEQLQKEFDDVVTGNTKLIINYLSEIITSPNNTFTPTLLGHENITLYDGSLFASGKIISLSMKMDLEVAHR